MQVVTTPQTVVSGGVERTGVFAISTRNQAQVMAILREGLYTDKVLAVLREYSSNAWDSHRTSGKGHVPIKVTLPTDMNPTLIIRDFGPGMSEEDIFEVFTQYGDSTKRDDDESVGAFGIGSKSGFSYSRQFTVISYHSGMKRIYTAVLEETDIGRMDRMYEEPCGDETGIEIRIAVERPDMYLFNERAKTYFRYYDPRPEINIGIPEVKQVKVDHGFLIETENSGNSGGFYASPSGGGYNEWIAVMGCNPYRINMNQVKSELEKAGLWVAVPKMSGGLVFKIGEVEVSANREELKYTAKTKKAIVEQLALVLHEYSTALLRDLKDGTKTDWEKRLKVRAVANRWAGSTLSLPDLAQGLSSERVFLWDTSDPAKFPKTFTVVSPKDEAVSSIPVESWTRIVIKDDPRSLKGYKHGLKGGDYVIRPLRNATPDDMKAELAPLVKTARLTGIEMVNISALTWTQSSGGRGGSGIDGRKWSTTTFLLKTQRSYCYPWSSCWEIVDHEPEEDDVFVIVKGFLPEEGSPDRGLSFFSTYERDKALVEALGGVMPPVYGYKTTASEPVTSDKVVGVLYSDWRKNYMAKLSVSNQIQEQLEQWQWSSIIVEGGYYYEIFKRKPDDTLAKMGKILGMNHPIIEFLQKCIEGHRATKAMPPALLSIFPQLSKILNLSHPSETVQKGLLDSYPLLRVSYEGLHLLWDDQGPAWCEYVRLVDNSKSENADPDPETAV